MFANRKEFLTWEAASRDTIDVKKAYVDLAGGNLAAGVLLSQIIFWHLPNKTGESKLRIQREGQYWLAKTYAEIWEECRIPERTARDAYKRIVDLGLIEKRLWKFNGAPTVHVRILWSEFLAALRAQIGSGKNAGSTRQGRRSNRQSSRKDSANSADSLTETPPPETPTETLTEIGGVGANIQKTQKLIDNGVWAEQAETLADEFSAEEIEAAIAATNQEQPSKPGAFLAAMLNRWAKQPTDRQAALGQYHQSGAFWQ